MGEKKIQMKRSGQEREVKKQEAKGKDKEGRAIQIGKKEEHRKRDCKR